MSAEEREISVLYGGVPYHIEGNGGPDCVEFHTSTRRLLETLVFSLLSVALLMVGLKGVQPFRTGGQPRDSFGRVLLLALFSLVFGVEVGFKLSTRQVIWLLNPCHILSFIQIILLVAPSHPWMTALFRLHVYWLTGPLLAILFPVTNGLLLPGEVTVYWVQHFLLMLIPLHLMANVGGQFNLEPRSDLAWPCLAFSIYSLYHWLVLQPIGLVAWTNLNCMICPAITDPFNGQNYRVVAMTHQVLLVPLVGKLYSWVNEFLNTRGCLATNNNTIKDMKE